MYVHNLLLLLFPLSREYVWKGSFCDVTKGSAGRSCDIALCQFHSTPSITSFIFLTICVSLAEESVLTGNTVIIKPFAVDLSGGCWYKIQKAKDAKNDWSSNVTCLHNNNLFTYFLLHTIYYIILLLLLQFWSISGIHFRPSPHWDSISLNNCSSSCMLNRTFNRRRMQINKSLFFILHVILYPFY